MIPPILPLSTGTYEVYYPNEQLSVEEYQVELRLIPTLAIVAGTYLVLNEKPMSAVALVTCIPIAAALMIWPISGGPGLRLFTKVVGS
jgi:hypothetical protein